MGRSGDLDVPDGETESGEDLPDGHLVSDGLDALRGSDSSDLLILEAGEYRWEEGRRPDGVVVGEDDDIGGGVSNSVGHLETFVGEGDGEDSNLGRVNGVRELLERTEHPLLRDDDDLLRVSDEPAVGSLLELFSGVDGRNDDGDVLGREVGWMFRERDGRVGSHGG